MENATVIKISDDNTSGNISEKPSVNFDKKEVCKDENMNSHTGNLLKDDDIPLIDSQAEPEEIPVVIQNTKPKPMIVIKPGNMYFNPSVLNSPDIFHLRAPLVSCENLLTPAMSQENIISNK
jgi:alanine-alpha-ketoisovalerate/valine-pyruvate aminotransferase